MHVNLALLLQLYIHGTYIIASRYLWVRACARCASAFAAAAASACTIARLNSGVSAKVVPWPSKVTSFLNCSSVAVGTFFFWFVYRRIAVNTRIDWAHASTALRKLCMALLGVVERG